MNNIYRTSCALLFTASTTLASGTLFENDDFCNLPDFFGNSVTNESSLNTNSILDLSYSEILSKDCQKQFIDLGNDIIRDVVSGNKIDLENVDYFSLIPLEDVEYEASFSKVSSWLTPISSMIGSVREWHRCDQQ